MAGLSLSQLFRRYTDDGDVRALGEVFDRAAPELLTVARHLAGDEAAAEDLVQATFLAAIEHPERFDPTRDLVPWLLGILANKARAARTSEARVPDPARLPGERVEDPETDAQLREFMGTLEKALERVPEAYRNVLRIHLAEGKGAEEIARELERNSDTVRVQLHRGLRHLRRRLPAGFALGGLVVIMAPKGLASIRTQVLERAGSLVGSGAAGGATAGVVGGVVVGKKIVVTAVLILLASTAWWLLRDTAATDVDTRTAQDASIELEPTARGDSTDMTMLGAPEGSSRSPSVAATAPSSDTDGSLDMEWVWKDGTAAAGLGVGGVTIDPSGSTDQSFFGPTDELGHVTFEHLHSGKVVIQSDRGCNSEFFQSSLEAGKRTFVRYSVQPGEDVRGRVLDPEGRPLAGALVWIAQHRDIGGSVVARSQNDGSFLVRDVDRSCGLFATQEGFGSSAFEVIRERSLNDAGILLLDLSLRGDGGNLSGVVRDPEGRPLGNAWVVVHCSATSRDGELQEWPCPWTATDAAGGFRLDGVREGLAKVCVDFEGFAPWTGTATVVARSTANIDAWMEKGFAVEGTVLTVEGTPAQGTRITQGPRAGSPEYVYRRHQSTVADEQGHFRLSPIPSGPIDFRAELRTKSEFGRASTSLNGSVGETLTWNPVLERGLEIRGHLVDDAGHSVPGWRVEAGTDVVLDSHPRSVDTDSEGRFVLLDCADVPFRVAAYPPQKPGQRWRASAGAILDDVHPGRDEVILTVTRESRPSAFLFGRIVDELEQPVTEAHVIASHRVTSRGTGTETSKGDGSFRIGPLPAGAYDVSLDRKGLPGLVLGPFEIGPEEQRDLGVIQLKARGRFELVIHREDGALVEEPFLMLLNGRYGMPLKQKDGSTFRSDELYAGSYILVPEGANVATVQQSVEIRGGETTRLDLRLPAGVLQQIRFRAPEGQTGPRYLRIVVQSSEGKVLLDRDAWTGFGRDGAKESNITAGFAPGRYTVDARSDDGWRSSASFEVEATTSTTKPIEAPLLRKP